MDRDALLIEIRADIKDIQRSVHTIEVLDAKQNAELTEHTRRSTANEKRLEKLENFKWYFTGLSIIIVTLSKMIEKLFI